MEKHNKKTRKLTRTAGYLLVLTALIVGGLHWYARAYVRYQITRMTEMVTLLAVNIQSAYLSQPNYGTLTTEEAIQQQFFPPKVLYADTSPRHLQNGRIEVFSDSLAKKADDNEAFVIRFYNLTSKMCVSLATYDWESNKSSGLVAMEIYAQPDLKTLNTVHLHRYCDGVKADMSAAPNKGYTMVCMHGSKQDFPLTQEQANQACNCIGQTCMITWKYM